MWVEVVEFLEMGKMRGPIAASLMLAVLIVPTLMAISDQAIAKDDVVILKQGWSEQDRLEYYYTSQGTAMLSYELFLNLENATNTELFRSDRTSESYGLIPQAADPKFNPDGLPIGMTKAVVPDGRWKGEWAGITCAACHTSQLQYKGARVRIDGGAGSSFNFLAFLRGLGDALSATMTEPEKFERLAAKMSQSDANSKAVLRQRLAEAADQFQYVSNVTALTPFDVGPGRADCPGLVHNLVASSAMGIPENWAAILAPAKIPFLWDTPQSSWVEWNGVANNPLGRSTSEATGVFIKLDLSSKSTSEGLFDSTLDLKGQFAIERLLRRLAPPKWPENIFGPIDRAKAAEGAKLFAENCSECHSVYPHRWSDTKLQGKRFIENALVPLDVVGTDPMQFNSPQFIAKPTTMTGAVSDYLAEPYTGAALAPSGAIARAVVTNVSQMALAKLNLTEEQLIDAEGYRSPGERGPPQPVYKAGPRDGVWSTGPFLHNGSVPNLYELLLPAAERSKTFFIGRDFDPVKVGTDTSGNSGKFLFDASLIGNSNAGHSFQDGPTAKGIIGRKLTEPERWALVEYLKSIPTEDAQITPYGGPMDPVEAWKDPIFFHNNNKTGYDGKY